jgi:hypothetical protein
MKKMGHVLFFLLSALFINAQGEGIPPASACPQSYRDYYFEKLRASADPADPRREAIYEERCEWINEFNKHNKELGFVLGMNRQFADRLPEEIDALSRGLVDNDKNDVLQTSQRTRASLSTTIDWRDPQKNPKGVDAVTSVKYQGECGACWAFSTLAVVEGAVAIRGDSLVSLVSKIYIKNVHKSPHIIK